MKKLLLASLLVVGLTVGTSAAIGDHYNDYQNKKQQETQAAQKAQAEEARTLQAAARLEAVTAFNNLKAQYEELRVECVKGLDAYNKLTPYTKTQTAAPTCPALLQE
jgi:hypothetical protein